MNGHCPNCGNRGFDICCPVSSAEHDAAIEKERENDERDLAIWWEAYRAALTGAMSILELGVNRTLECAHEGADGALEAYKAKAKSLGVEP